MLPQSKIGGGERVRTDDLLRARQALSQLSYTPKIKKSSRVLYNAVYGLYSTGSALYAFSWWAWMELNHRPHAYQACALTKLSYRPSVILLWQPFPARFNFSSIIRCRRVIKLQNEPIIHLSKSYT